MPKKTNLFCVTEWKSIIFNWEGIKKVSKDALGEP